jgi:hypothetical protein
MGSEKPTTCPECGSSDIRWEYSAIKKNNVVDGRLKLNEASLIGYLGCDGCSHTLRTLPIEQAVESRIQAEVVRLREALEQIATCVTSPAHRDYLSPDAAKELARAALAPTKEVTDGTH